MLRSAARRVAQLGTNLGAVARRVGAGVVSAVIVPVPTAPEGFPEAFELARAGLPPLSDSALAYAVRRVAGAVGIGAELNNPGELLCLLPHEHGGDGRCVVRGARAFRRYPDLATGLRRLLIVSRCASGDTPVAPLCPQCGAHDAELKPGDVLAGLLAGLGDDISNAWDLCSFCRKIGANIGGATSDDFGPSVSVEELDAAPPSDGNVSGYHSRDPNDRPGKPPEISAELPDLDAAEDTAGSVEVDELGAAPEAGSLEALREGWRVVIAKRDAQPEDCPCRAKTAPLIEAWQRFERIKPGDVVTERQGEGWKRMTLAPEEPAQDEIARQWTNLRAAQEAQGDGGAAPDVVKPGDIVVDVRTPAEFAEGHHPEARNIPLASLPVRMVELRALTGFSSGPEGWRANPLRRVVLFCATGGRAGRGARMLQAQGFQAVNGHTLGQPADDDAAQVDAPEVDAAQVGDIETARAELATKGKRQIEAETAETWKDRAIVLLEKYAKTRLPDDLVQAASFAHEAIEHGAEAGDDALTKVRQDLAAAKVRLGLEELDDLGSDAGRIAAAIFTGGASEVVLASQRARDAANARVRTSRHHAASRAHHPASRAHVPRSAGRRRAGDSVSLGPATDDDLTADDFDGFDVAGVEPDAPELAPAAPADPGPLECKVQELAAAWDGEAMRARGMPAVRARLSVPLARWRAQLDAYRSGAQLDTARAADDLGAFTSDAQKTKIADIHARLKTHNQAVQEGRDKLGAEPELTEYVARWEAFVREMNALGERANAVLSWITDDELTLADARLGALLKEWPAVGQRIELHRRQRVNKLMEDALESSAAKEKAGTAKGPPPGQAPTVVTVPDLRVDLPQSAATVPNVPPPPQDKPGMGAGRWAAIGAAILAALAFAAKAVIR